jgi:hypothetical protein
MELSTLGGGKKEFAGTLKSRSTKNAALTNIVSIP